MADQLIHRGPDDAGLFANESVGFGHRRLSILDIEGGHQPMSNIDSSVTLIFNGEIFNYVELRSQLENAGLQFQTQSDTEVVAQMYAHYGLSFVDHLNGQFAIVLWDHTRRRLVMARDRVGICPLYYMKDRGGLIFGSEVKALRPALSGGLEMCPEVLDEIFTFWTPVPPRTIYRDVLELEPGHILVADESGHETRPYWDWQYPGKAFLDPLTESQACDELYALLDDATRIRLRSDVPVGAYLSGGLDSSALVYLVNTHAQERLTTFSLSFAQNDLDETRYQEMLRNSLNTRHRNIEVSASDVSAHLGKTLRHTETPILRSAPIAMGLLSSLVNDNGYKVVLTGEGADECFGGYDIFKEAKVRRFWARNPQSNWRPLLLKRLYPYLQLPKDGSAAYLRRFFGQQLENTGSPYYAHLPRWNTTAKIKQFYHADFAGDLAKKSSPEQRLDNRLAPGLIEQHAFNQAQYVESKTLMSGYLLTSQGDRMLMMNSVEGRFPFLDHRVIEFANRLHPNLKMKVLNEKYLLKKTMRNRIPSEIITRHKQPYRAPDILHQGNHETDQLLDELLDPAAIEKAAVFDAKKVSFLRKKALKKAAVTVSESQALMGILSTQAVHRNFIGRGGL